MTLNDLQIVDCPACGPVDFKLWMDDGKPTQYVKCSSCGTIYARPRAPWAARFSWLDKKFSYGANAVENATSRSKAYDEESRIVKLYAAGGKILDIGCDLGDFFKYFPAVKWELFGVEVSPSAAAYASKTYNAQVFTGMLREANNNPSYFDLITMLDTIFYLDDPLQDVKEIYRLLKPGGILAIEVTGVKYQMLRSRGIVSYLTNGQYTRLHTDSSYNFWFSYEGLKKMLNNCSFEIKSIYPINSPDINKGVIYQQTINTYYKITKRISDISKNFFDWLPKYLVIAQKP
jgi:SAM-dependent methyltransferase